MKTLVQNILFQSSRSRKPSVLNCPPCTLVTPRLSNADIWMWNTYPTIELSWTVFLQKLEQLLEPFPEVRDHNRVILNPKPNHENKKLPFCNKCRTILS